MTTSKLTEEEIEMLKVAFSNWKLAAGAPATIGEWLAPTSLGEHIRMGTVLLWALEAEPQALEATP